MEINIPPLRERYEDIPLLITHFCKIFGQAYKKDIDAVSDEVLETFMHYAWPGNVRELEHAIERAFVLSRDPIIGLAHIPAEIKENSRSPKPVSTRKTGDDPEELIKILEKTDWNISKAARIMGISRWTLYRRFEKHRISRPTEKV
jgi:DNA-binding NtrC family response regulator